MLETATGEGAWFTFGAYRSIQTENAQCMSAQPNATA